MRYEITARDSDVDIHLHETGEHTAQLLASLQQCQQGRCGCPTDQHDRLEDITVHDTPDEHTIQLRPCEGQRLDTSQLQACVDYTIAAANQDPD